jgi:hypothetical protein
MMFSNINGIFAIFISLSQQQLKLQPLNGVRDVSDFPEVNRRDNELISFADNV